MRAQGCRSGFEDPRSGFEDPIDKLVTILVGMDFGAACVAQRQKFVEIHQKISNCSGVDDSKRTDSREEYRCDSKEI